MFVIVDSGFWFAFFNERDQYHNHAKMIMEKLETCAYKFVVPWPSLYEVLNENFVERADWKSRFDSYLKKETFFREDDSPYRGDALLLSIDEKKYSLVDAIINLMIEKNQRIDALVTFNTPDFEAAKKRNIKIFDENFSD